MKIKFSYKHLSTIFIFILISVFFFAHKKNILYGLPFFLNLDEINFQGSTLSSLGFITGYFESGINPLYAPLLNIIIILKSIFINEFLFNSISNLSEIKSKLYFNPELFLYYGRIANLTITSISIFILYLIFKKLKIRFIIYSILLVTFASSLVAFNVSTIMGKNSSYLLIYLIQLYFLIKYLLNTKKFNLKSYYIFGILASLAWGVNYWPAFISIYGVFFLHYKKYKFTKINFLLIFLVIFLIFGPIVNLFFVSTGPLHFLLFPDNSEGLKLYSFFNIFINDIFKSFEILYASEKNIILLALISPLFFLNKLTRFKKEYLIIFLLIFEPIFLFALSYVQIPQLRYFAGVNCVILILTGVIFNELIYRGKLTYLIPVILIINSFFIYDNLKLHAKIHNIISKKHSFYNFNANISQDKSKILYLVDLNIQESLNQNLYYLQLFEKNLIKKNQITQKLIDNIDNKIHKIENAKNIITNYENLKKDLIYFNYSYFPINNLELFFDYIKNDFDYVVIEESIPFYLTNIDYHNQIRSYIKKNFVLEKLQYDEKKIFLRSQETVIHYFSNSLIPHEYAQNINNNELEIIYGSNYSLYKLN